MSGQTFIEAQPVAVVFREKDCSPASGMRFGVVEVMLRNATTQQCGYLPKLGAEAVARDLGVPLLLDPHGSN